MSEAGYSINDFKHSIHVFEGEHSPWGPSSAKRWINCPGSVLATKDMPDPGSQWAAEGTAAHTISELCRVRGCLAKAFLGYKVHVGQFTFDFDAEFAASVQEFIDWCNEIPGTILVEQKVHYPHLVPKGFGTLDDGRLAEPRVIITDFKHGKGVQEFAKENEQLMMQALGVLHDYSWLYKIDEFLLRICQPRLDHKDTWLVSVPDLLAWAQRVVPEAYQKTLAGKEFKAGAWCKFCRIKRTCAVRANMALQTVTGSTFDAIPEEGETVTLRTIPLAPDELYRLLPFLEPIKKWCADVEHAVVAALQEGKVVGDAKMVEGRSNRHWKVPANAPALIKAAGLNPFEEPALRSVAQVEQEMGKKAFKEAFAEHVEKPPGKPKLAYGDDPRPPVKKEVLTNFTSLEDDD